MTSLFPKGILTETWLGKARVPSPAESASSVTSGLIRALTLNLLAPLAERREREHNFPPALLRSPEWKRVKLRERQSLLRRIGQKCGVLWSALLGLVSIFFFFDRERKRVRKRERLYPFVLCKRGSVSVTVWVFQALCFRFQSEPGLPNLIFFKTKSLYRTIRSDF